MKKILIVISVAILMALFSAPSIVKAEMVQIGTAIVTKNGVTFQADLYCDEYPLSLNTTYINSKYWINSQGRYSIEWRYDNQSSICFVNEVNYMYIPTLEQNITIERGPAYNPTLYKTYAYNNLSDYNNNIPDEFRPEDPSVIDQIWDSFYDLFELIFGYRPMSGSIYDLLRRNADGEDNEITFPTLTPTPSPTPTPTPIPVQTIFVPDGNGNTTIIYQYPDPTSGVITQSPYNPNIQNNITVNCECDGDGTGSETFTVNPQDPYSLDASLLWADGFGVEMSENPLQATEDQQASLKEAAMEYDESVLVMSNSYNILPVKWILLAGLLGGILIIAGLIRTFLGG